jgi:hypothetical protein
VGFIVAVNLMLTPVFVEAAEVVSVVVVVVPAMTLTPTLDEVLPL